MIGGFPDPYPDELLFSVCARFQKRMRHRSQTTTFQELFGVATARAVVEFPTHVARLVSELPRGHAYTPDQWIDQHTMLPFYSPFLPPERVEYIRTAMRERNGRAIYVRVGFLTTRLRLEFLRYCSLCVEEDRSHFGETYWHRSHQVPGLDACPVHAIFLQNSAIRVRQAPNCYGFVAAEEVIQTLSVQPLDQSDPDHTALLHLAREAAWLLQQRVLGMEYYSRRNRYLHLFFEQKLASYPGVVNQRKLLHVFHTRYSSAFLTRLRCELRGQDSWLLRLFGSARNTHHPIHHLLLLHSLGCSVETFFLLPAERKPFGEGPWPCLNPASDHFRQPTISDYQLSFTRTGYRKPMGLFRCDCGFSYRRVGPDQSMEARLQIAKPRGIRSFGPVWESALKALWAEAKHNLSEMARRLDVSEYLLECQAVRLGLVDISECQNSKIIQLKPRLGSPKSSAAVMATRERHQKTWLQAVHNHPNASITELRDLVPSTYGWLNLHRGT